MTASRKTNIIMCGQCDGEGIVHCKELTCYHNGNYDYWDEECTRCKGTGRLVQTISIETTEEAFVPEKPRKRK